MIALAFYLLKVFVCSGILTLYYLIALKDKAFHQWNRFYLLSAVALSIVLPLVQIVVMTTAEKSTAIQLIQVVQSADDYMETITITSRPHISTGQWITAIYAFASLLLFTAAVLSLVKIHRLAKKWGVQKVEGIRFINTAEPGTPFSFWRSVFWNREIPLQSEAGRQIFQHELVHIKEKHTLDKLFLQAVMVVFWCNPFFWLIKKELRFIHEFIADKQSIGEAGTADFATMILQAAYPSQYSSLVNPFFQTSIKRRLAMLTKMQNRRLNYAARVLALPLIALVAFAFTVRTKNNPIERPLEFLPLFVNTDTLPKAKKEIVSVDVNKAKSLLTIYYTDGSCETMTELEANNHGLINNGGFYGNTAAKSPANSNVSGEASVITSMRKPTPLYFVDNIETSPETANKLDPNSIASIDVLMGDKASKSYGEKGKNGIVEITTKGYNKATLGSSPVYILDGLEVDARKINATSPATIESVNVLKGPSAIEFYGEKGKNGVVLIKSKEAVNKKPTTLILNDSVQMQARIIRFHIQDSKQIEFAADVVTVYGKPLSNKTIENVSVQGKLSTQNENEAVTVVGHPLKKEPVFEQTETPATIDKTEWRNFLSKNAQPIIENMARSGVKPGTYVANVRFLVEKDGSLSNISLVNDLGYGADEKIIAMMKSSPKWVPAQQNGKTVRSYHTQPISLMISNQ